MKRLAGIILALLCLVVAAFCAFGFLATFEPLPVWKQWTFRVIYVLAGCGALLQSGRLTARAFRTLPPL